MTIDLKMATAKHYRVRVMKVKDKLPKNYRKILYSNFPELKTDEGKRLIDCVLQGLKTHIQLTEVFESIVRGELKIKGVQELELDKAA
jgi:hypothetical protein